MKLLHTFFQSTSGATSIEYGVIGGLVSIAIATAVGSAGFDLRGFYEDFGGQIVSALTR